MAEDQERQGQDDLGEAGIARLRRAAQHGAIDADAEKAFRHQVTRPRPAHGEAFTFNPQPQTKGPTMSETTETKTERKHSPLPFTVLPMHAEHDGKPLVEIVDANALNVAAFVFDHDGEFIVRACNCHDELLAALKAIAKDAPDTQPEGCLDCGNANDIYSSGFYTAYFEAATIARAVIAKAEESAT
jgi:hypothetical protein